MRKGENMRRKKKKIKKFKRIFMAILSVLLIVYFKSSFFESINKVFISIFEVDFKNPVTLIDSRVPLFNLFDRGFALGNNNYSSNNSQNEEIVQKLLTEESSLEFISEHLQDESMIEKSGNISFIKECDVRVNAEELLAKPFKINFNKKGPKVLIYHTHASESYLQNLKKDGDSRNNGVIRVGDDLTKRLKIEYGIDAIHDTTINDRPDSRYSYNKSFYTVTNMLKKYPSIQLVIDLHRDGISNTEKFRPVINIEGVNVSKIMIVVGTNYTGLEHPNWMTNLTLAVNMQKRIEEIRSGIARPITISKNRYNQHVTNYSLIVEVGGDGNTIEESIESNKYLADAINYVINK
jgi:stage II sporulation protein P